MKRDTNLLLEPGAKTTQGKLVLEEKKGFSIFEKKTNFFHELSLNSGMQEPIIGSLPKSNLLKYYYSRVPMVESYF